MKTCPASTALSHLWLFVVLTISAPTLALPNHPLDALEAAEITRAAAILRSANHIDDVTPLLSLDLAAPAKQEVLAWHPDSPFSRRARAVIRRDGITREFIVDIKAGEVISTEVVPGPGQPPIAGIELFSAINIALNHPDMQRSLTKRGITNFDALFCPPRTVGNFGAIHEQSSRVVKVDCFDLSNNPSNIFASPIEGLFATVDLDAGKVLEVVDLGTVPVNQATYSLSPEAQKSLRKSKVVTFDNPHGSNIEVDGWNVSWQNWRFHLRWDMRAGVVLSTAAYQDNNKLRSVLYQGNISEIYVPYQDTTQSWYYRNYMDEGDYGLGTTHSPLIKGVDCPDNAHYMTPVMANAAGGADQLTDRVCLFERPTGDATWRHYDIATEALDGRANVELVVRYIATVGNYDYLFHWVFDNKAQLTYRLGASGLDAVKGVKSSHLTDSTAGQDTRFGPLIAPGLAGINHDHFFSVRLDVDIDGVKNKFVRDKLVANRQTKESPRTSIWQAERVVSTNDSEAKFRLNFEKPSLWRVESAIAENYLGYATSFALKPGGNARPLVDEDDPALNRAQFANYHLWVTPYREDERWAAGHYSNQAQSGQGLPAWTRNNRNIEDIDIVLWYTLGFHHIPSAEDWPVYNLGWNGVTLRPYNFFDQNPAMDLP
jgi:primary-amine oxidase